MNTCKKFTLIFSAHQASESDLLNLINNQRLELYLSCEVYVEYTRAVGVYKGGAEPVFVVHLSSASLRAEIVRHVLTEYNQECVLVSFNRSNTITLKSLDKCIDIGSVFKHHRNQPRADNYTVLNATDYYTVY